jgi:hypothetical protein
LGWWPPFWSTVMVATYANQHTVKAQLRRMVAGPVSNTNSSSCTSGERALLTLQCQQGRQYEATYTIGT